MAARLRKQDVICLLRPALTSARTAWRKPSRTQLRGTLAEGDTSDCHKVQPSHHTRAYTLKKKGKKKIYTTINSPPPLFVIVIDWRRSLKIYTTHSIDKTGFFPFPTTLMRQLKVRCVDSLIMGGRTRGMPVNVDSTPENANVITLYHAAYTQACSSIHDSETTKKPRHKQSISPS